MILKLKSQIVYYNKLTLLIWRLCLSSEYVIVIQIFSFVSLLEY